MEPESLRTNKDDNVRSAKDEITSVITDTLCSKPGYHIVESYKDCLLEALPADYNNTLIRLQTLIGASDHMVQWALSGDTSKANHRIYQIVLVHECFQPHFIKFCDIMEVLATGSVEFIVKLRKSLIKQLYTDGFITEEEAFHLTSTKLFRAPVPITSMPCINLVRNGTVLASNTVNDKATSSTSVKCTDTTSIDPSMFTSGLFIRPADSASAFTGQDVTVVSIPHSGENSSEWLSGNNAGNLVPCDTNIMQELHTVETSSAAACTNSDHVQCMAKNSDDAVVTVKTVPEDEYTSLGCSDGGSQHDSIPDAVVHVSQNLTSSNSMNFAEESADIQGFMSERAPTSITSPSGTNSVTVVLTQDGPVNSDQLEFYQLIDINMLNRTLSYDDIAHICLSPPLERKTTIIQLLKDSADSEVHAKESQTEPAKVKLDFDEHCMDEVHEVLEAKDFAIVKSKYKEILECFPENHDITIGSLQDCLSDSHICEILSMTFGHNQKILNCLIQQLKTKEDLFDFCDRLEKVDRTLSSLKLIVEQIRKGVTDLLQAKPEQPVSTSTNSSTKTDKKFTPVLPPPIILPVHPHLLVIPKAANPFETCLLPADSEGLVAMKRYYSALIDNLPQNHLISLVRLQNVAIIPEEIIDSIVPSPSAEIGNKLIVNYLIGLIHTEEHIITFCKFMKNVIGDLDRWQPVLNLLNKVVTSYNLEATGLSSEDSCIYDIAKTVVLESSAITKFRPVVNFELPAKEEKDELSSANDKATKEISEPPAIAAAKDDLTATLPSIEIQSHQAVNHEHPIPNITCLVKSNKRLTCHHPYLHDDEVMLGYVQCMIIDSNGGEYNNTLKAVALEKPNKDSEVDSTKPVMFKDTDAIKSFINKDCVKEYAFCLCDQPGDQQSKQFYLDSIEILFKECSKAGAWIYYTGYGQEGTGNWCFKDGTISFQDIFTLYKKYLKGKLLYLYADCSYSGQWVVECAKCLDEMGIGACGHQAIKQGIMLKIFTSCRPDQKAIAHAFIQEKGIHYHEPFNSIACFCVKKLSDTQNTYGCAFTGVRCMQDEGPKASCHLPDIPAACSWKWVDIVAIDYKKRPSCLLYTVRGKDKGREAWHYVLVERDLEDVFLAGVESGTVDVAKFGFVVKSGWGKNPPDDITKRIEKCCPQYY